MRAKIRRLLEENGAHKLDPYKGFEIYEVWPGRYVAFDCIIYIQTSNIKEMVEKIHKSCISRGFMVDPKTFRV